ncbi:lysin, partial [Bacillus thuringiensis]|nr:lysin [Bacillus thuringiensis]
MYNVVIVNNGIETIIHSPYVEGAKVLSGVIKKEINLVDSFYFSLHGKNPGFHLIRPLQTRIKVWNTRTQTYEFEGRILGPSKHMESSGLYSESYECEGELGYLHDSVQRHVEFRGTPLQLITTIVAYHNVQVEVYKQFQVGNVSLTNSTDYLYVYLSAEKSTFDVIKEKVIDKLGGELQIRKENG